MMLSATYGALHVAPLKVDVSPLAPTAKQKWTVGQDTDMRPLLGVTAAGTFQNPVVLPLGAPWGAVDVVVNGGDSGGDVEAGPGVVVVDWTGAGGPTPLVVVFLWWAATVGLVVAAAGTGRAVAGTGGATCGLVVGVVLVAGAVVAGAAGVEVATGADVVVGALLGEPPPQADRDIAMTPENSADVT
jgi:hypothetical protein